MTYSSAYAPGPSPRWGEGKVNIRFNSLAPLGERVAEGRVRGKDSVFSQLLRLVTGGEGHKRWSGRSAHAAGDWTFQVETGILACLELLQRRV